MFAKRSFWLLALGLAAFPAQATNVLSGGDFSSGLTGWNDTLWRYQASTSVAGTVAVDSTATTYDSSTSPGLKVAVTTVDGTNWHLRYYLPTFTATKGNTYHLSFWAKSAASGTLLLGIDSVSTYKSASSFTTSSTWKKYSFSYTALASGSGAVTFSIYLGTATGTFYFDDFDIEEEAAVTLVDTMVQPSQGAWYTGNYRNLFTERGYNADTVNNRLARAYQQLFFSSDTSSESIYRVVPSDTTMGYIDASGYILTEGQSYGMIISLMMDRQDVFNKLWKFAKTYSQHHSDSTYLRGLFRWKLNDYSPYSYYGTYGYTPAPDGEEYFVTALYLAAQRWGSDTGWFDYQTQADSLLTYMTMARSGGVVQEIDSTYRQILFSVTMGSSVKFTDPSYHVPAFYRMWGAFAGHDTAFFRSMGDSSVAFLKRHMQDSTGLCAERANFDGSTVVSSSTGSLTYSSTSYATDTIYYSDSHRTSMNIGVDWSWFQPDTWEISQTRKNLGFFIGQGSATSYKQAYTRSGSPLSSYSAAQSQLGANGAAVLASDTSRDWAFIDALYGIDVPSGTYRYYNGLVYMLGYLHASGNFKAYGSPGLKSSSISTKAKEAQTLSAKLQGSLIVISGASGRTARLLDARGREAARASVASGKAEFAAPGHGLWIVESGKSRKTVAVP